MQKKVYKSLLDFFRQYYKSYPEIAIYWRSQHPALAKMSDKDLVLLMSNVVKKYFDVSYLLSRFNIGVQIKDATQEWHHLHSIYYQKGGSPKLFRKAMDKRSQKRKKI